MLAREPEWDDLPSDTPPRIRHLLERCLDKEPGQRLQAIGEARIAIERFLADPEGDRTVVAGVERAGAARRWLPWAIAGLVAAVAVSAALLRPRGGADQPTMRLEVKISDDPLFVNLGSSAELSPDGSRLVYVTDGEGGRTLSVRSLDQLEGTPLVTGNSQSQPYHPFFSPDGQWVGFVTPVELKKVPITGGTPIALCKVNRSRGAS